MCRNNKTKTVGTRGSATGSLRPRRLGPWWLPQGTTQPRQPATCRAPVALPVSLVARTPDATLTNARSCSGRAPGTAGQPALCHPYRSPSHSWAGRFAGERISAQPSEESSGCGGGTIATSWLRAPRGCPHRPSQDNPRDRFRTAGGRHEGLRPGGWPLTSETGNFPGLGTASPRPPLRLLNRWLGPVLGSFLSQPVPPDTRSCILGAAVDLRLAGAPRTPGQVAPGEPLGAGLGEERLWGRLHPRLAVPQARTGIRGTRSF